MWTLAALAFVPGSSSILLEGSDGGIFGTTNANAAAEATLRPTWFNMDTGLNTIEFYAGDISGNFANTASSVAVGGAQDGLVSARSPCFAQRQHVVQIVSGFHRGIHGARAVAVDRHDRHRHAIFVHVRRRST